MGRDIGKKTDVTHCGSTGCGLSGHGRHERQLSNGNGKMRDKLKSLNQRRKSLVMKRGSSASKSEDGNGNGGGMTGLPKPPKRRNSQVGMDEEKYNNGKGKKKGPHHRPTATFFKKAVGDGDMGSVTKNGLSVATAKNGKELQMVSQALSSDLASKTESMQHLQMANTALMQKMESMQLQMKQMQNTQNGHSQNDNSISDLP